MQKAFLAIGSYEQHGKHLPFDTDTIISEYFIKRLTDAYKGQFFPSLPYGLSTEHKHFSNTITLAVDAYMGLLEGVFSSILSSEDIETLIVLNGHGGNRSLLDVVATQMNYSRDDKKIITLTLYPQQIQDYAEELFGCFDTHAGSVEASLVAHINEDLEDETIEDDGFIKKLSGGLRFFTSDVVSSTGVISDIGKVEISRGNGELIANRIEKDLIKQVEEAINSIGMINVQGK